MLPGEPEHSLQGKSERERERERESKTVLSEAP